MDKYFAGLMKKHKISDNKFIYTYVDSRIFDRREDIFIDEDNNYYFSMLSKTSIDSDIDLVIGPVQKVEEFRKNYESISNGDFSSLTDLDYLEQFKGYINDLFYLVTVDGDKISCINYTINASGMDEYDYEDDEYDNDITSLVSNIVSGEYSISQLKNLKQSLIEKEEEINGVIDTIDLELASRFNDNNSSVDLYKQRGLVNINDVFNKVTKTLIAQDEAALEFITAIAMIDMDTVSKKGILLTGSTGVGKTKLMKLVAKYLDRPFLLIDSTQVTVPGYAGRNVEEYLYTLLKDCNFDVERAERAIVFFDEIDKKGVKGEGNHSGKGVLDLLLKFLDGTKYVACENLQLKNPGTYQEIDTSSMIIIAGGSFKDVYNNPYEKKVGFKSNEVGLNKEVRPEDFVKKGNMTDEFMGRFSTVIHLRDLKALEYKKILLESDESPIIAAKSKFDRMDNVKLNFTDQYLEKICKMAEINGTGVRGLEGIVDHNICAPFKKINANLGIYDEVILDEDIVENKNAFKLLKKVK